MSITERPVTARPDASWFEVRMELADAAKSTDVLDVLAAAFAEDPERIGELLVELAELNDAADQASEERAADSIAGHACAVRQQLADALPLPVTLRMKEYEASVLAAELNSAAEKTISNRIRAGAKPLRRAS